MLNVFFRIINNWFFLDRRDEKTFREKGESWQIKTKTKGYRFEHFTCCLVHFTLVWVSFSPLFLYRFGNLTLRCVASCTAHIEAITSGEELIKNLGGIRQYLYHIVAHPSQIRVGHSSDLPLVHLTRRPSSRKPSMRL